MALRQAEVDRALRSIPVGNTCEVFGVRVTKTLGHNYSHPTMTAYQYAIEGESKPMRIHHAVRLVMKKAKTD